ncbi:MAG: CoA pyrophosphatase [Gemmatimonadaceae bacterium]|nr:CoA pyrophosphatase [Gemmatimonadaceae bacterium]
MSSADRLRTLAQRLDDRRAVEHAGDDPDRRWAAVAAVLRVTPDDDIELLLIRRPEKAGDPWSGHIALPGGRRDARDADLAATAIRETCEEVGIDLSAHGTVLGALDDLAPRNPALPPIVVRPFVALLHADVRVTANHEVAAHYWVPLALLASPEAAAEHVVQVHAGPGGNVPTAFARDVTETARVRARFPAYRFADEIIWGLTERVVRQLLGVLDGSA